ncbi:MAG: hypothetical protein JST12_09000 [Armatimonadetes bacterium]|nr:hypothetical protein [Armatimonadota bacterium]
MSQNAGIPERKELPERIRRQLKKGETIYHSVRPDHVNAKHPDGKWLAQLRREEKGKLKKFPVKGFKTAREALQYLEGLRPGAKGKSSQFNSDEPTVKELYLYYVKHGQKRIGEKTKRDKASRWRLHIEGYWGEWRIGEVTGRAAQDWISDAEEQIFEGDAGTLGLAQLEKVRTDLFAMFEFLPKFSPDYQDRRNPFANLEFVERAPRAKVTLESSTFSAIVNVCDLYAEYGLCTRWISEMFLTSLLSGIREGEVMALCEDQLDFENGAIVVDRAFRRDSRNLNPITRLEEGPILPQAINYPKRGTAQNDRTRVVPMSDQLAAILRRAVDARPDTPAGQWKLLWPSRNGTLKQLSRFTKCWYTLRDRLHELATYAPKEIEPFEWPELPTGRGRTRNPLIELAEVNSSIQLPNKFGAIDFRDARSSFGSYINEIGLTQATREAILGHEGRITNSVYTEITSATFQEARRKLTEGWMLSSL